jgi:hypothetical protein
VNFSSTLVISTTLSSHVVHVVLMGAEKEMVRVHANPVVTTVKNKESIRDFTSE